MPRFVRETKAQSLQGRLLCGRHVGRIKPWLQLRFDYDTTTIRCIAYITMFSSYEPVWDRRTTDGWTDRRTGKTRKAYITITIRLRHDYDTKIPRRIRLRWKWSKLRFAFDSTVIRLRHDYNEKLTCSFFTRVEWKQARAIRRSRIVGVS